MADLLFARFPAEFRKNLPIGLDLIPENRLQTAFVGGVR